MADEREDCQQADLAAWWQSECQIALRRAEAAEAALAEVRGRVCGTCRHQRVYTPDYSECGLTQGDDEGNRTECKTLGFTCGAYAPKESRA
jgi:hypothetical protein